MSPRALVLLLWLVPMSVWAAKLPGIRLYEQGEYARASRSLKAELKNPRRTPEDKVQVRVYLAASLLALGKQNEARQQLAELARTTSEPQVDPSLFPAALVEMEKQVRGRTQIARPPEPDQAEKDRLAALEADRLRREREEAERLERERQAAAHKPPVVVEQHPEEPVPEEEEASPSGFRLRPEIVGYVDALGNGSRGFGVGAIVGYGGLEAGLRLLPGPDSRWGADVEVGYAFGRGVFQPRLALRGTAVRGVGFGGGGVAGVRLTPMPRLTFLADLAWQRFSVTDKALYRETVLVASAGVGFNLF